MSSMRTSSSSLSRRGFLAGSLTAGVGALSVGAEPGVSRAEGGASGESLGTPIVRNPQYSFEYAPAPIDESLIEETVECDILVVGSGCSGIAGALFAATQGANVHIVEKGPEYGVHRLAVAGLNSQLALDMGLPEVSARDFALDLFRYSGNLQANFSVISRYARESGSFIDWLQSLIVQKGWTLLPMGNSKTEGKVWNDYMTMYMFMDPGGNSIATGKSPDWVELMGDIAVENGAQFHFNEPLVRLEREEGEDGRCTGVITRHCITGAYRRFKANMGVLLAAGDFFQDKEMVHKYCRHLEKVTMSIAEPNNSGDTHKAALWIGAEMDDYSAGDLFGFQNTKNLNWGLAPEFGDPDYDPSRDIVKGCMWAPALSVFPMLWVDNAGRRFIGEDTNGMIQSTPHVVLGNPKGQAWTIYDSAWESKLPSDYMERISSMVGISGLQMGCNTQRQIDKEVEAGLVLKFDSIEELIEGCGFDKETFETTLARYNDMCAKGEDEDCFKDPIWMTPIDTPPYYAAHWGVMITSTRCGLRTDECGRVLDKGGVPISGLYAAGNNGGCFYGITYPGSLIGTGIGHGQFYAWTAVRNMLGCDLVDANND